MLSRESPVNEKSWRNSPSHLAKIACRWRPALERILIAVTRFNALGDAAAKIPFGLTVPEMAALVGALGCRRAVSLDGGISGQLAVREAGGAMQKWTAWRLVPLGLLVLPQPAGSAGSLRLTQ